MFTQSSLSNSQDNSQYLFHRKQTDCLLSFWICYFCTNDKRLMLIPNLRFVFIPKLMSARNHNNNNNIFTADKLHNAWWWWYIYVHSYLSRTLILLWNVCDVASARYAMGDAQFLIYRSESKVKFNQRHAKRLCILTNNIFGRLLTFPSHRSWTSGTYATTETLLIFCWRYLCLGISAKLVCADFHIVPTHIQIHTCSPHAWRSKMIMPNSMSCGQKR